MLTLPDLRTIFASYGLAPEEIERLARAELGPVEPPLYVPQPPMTDPGNGGPAHPYQPTPPHPTDVGTPPPPEAHSLASGPDAARTGGTPAPGPSTPSYQTMPAPDLLMPSPAPMEHPTRGAGFDWQKMMDAYEMRRREHLAGAMRGM